MPHWFNYWKCRVVVTNSYKINLIYFAENNKFSYFSQYWLRVSIWAQTELIENDCNCHLHCLHWNQILIVSLWWLWLPVHKCNFTASLFVMYLFIHAGAKCCVPLEVISQPDKHIGILNDRSEKCLSINNNCRVQGHIYWYWSVLYIWLYIQSDSHSVMNTNLECI